MKRAVCLVFLISLLSHKMLSQAGSGAGIIVALSQRSTVQYSDTIFEIDQLKFKITETYAFRDKIKTTIIFYNKSDNFKIIHSEDFSIMDSDSNMIIVNAKKPIVIAPKSTKKIGLLAETKASFKLYDIKIGLKKIYTTGSPSVMKFGSFNLHTEGIDGMKNDVLEIQRTKCISYPGGITKAYFKVAYTGKKFLGIYRPNAFLLSANGIKYPNIAKKNSITYYPDEKVSMTLLMEYDNPSPNFNDPNCDKVSLENVFVEYDATSSMSPVEFHVYKNGMNEGVSPFDKKEREDITED